MSSIENTRPYKAGVSLARSVIEMVDLMYQNKTAQKFLRGLISTLSKEQQERIIKDHNYLSKE